MSEHDSIDLLIELFGWQDSADDKHVRYKALEILKRHRGEPAPSFDDFCAGIKR